MTEDLLLFGGQSAPTVCQGQFVIETANPFYPEFASAIPNRFFLAELDTLWQRNESQAQRIIDQYRLMGGSHIMGGPVFALGYGGQYPSTNWFGQAQEFARYLRWLAANGVTMTLVVMTDAQPYYDDGRRTFNRAAIERDWTPFYRELWNYVAPPARVVSQWEQWQDMDECGWLFDWMAREFPNSERCWHNPPNHLGPGPSDMDEAKCAQHAVDHGIQSWCYQADPYGGGDGRTAYEQCLYDLWDLVRRSHGYAGWPKGFKTYYTEGTAHPMYWHQKTQALAQEWGSGAMSVSGVLETWDGLP